MVLTHYHAMSYRYWQQHYTKSTYNSDVRDEDEEEGEWVEAVGDEKRKEDD